MSIESAGQGAAVLEGRFTTTATRERAWWVLTDYARIPRFVSSLRLSEVKERGADGILLAQESTVGALLILKRRFRVLLRVREEPPSRLSFHDISGDSLELYEGSWQLTETSAGVEVLYRLKAKSGSGTPAFVAQAVSRKAVRRLLAEVQAEMARR